jgi:hypothetical protein
MSYLKNAQELYSMIEQGKMMDAFEKYYHEDVVMIEPTGEVCKGKSPNRDREVKFMSGVKEFHGMGINNITSNEEKGITMVESWMDLTMQGGTRMKMEEVAVQHWNHDHIIEERFYFNVPK